MKINFTKILPTFLTVTLILSAASIADAQNTNQKQKQNQNQKQNEAKKQAEKKSSGQEGYVTIDFRNADIRNVLRILSLKSGTNIVAGPEVQGVVTIRLVNVPWETALDTVLRTYGYVYEREENVIRVTTREKVSQEDLVTETFVLNYITASEVVDAVTEMLTERGRVKTVQRTNTVLVTDVSSNLYKVGQVIDRLDKPTPQAYIDSRIVRTELGESENLGIQWSVEAGVTGSSVPTTFPFNQALPQTNIPGVFDAFLIPGFQNNIDAADFAVGTLNFQQLQAFFQMLKQRTNTKVVSNPRIVVLNNQTAKVQVGQQIGIPTFERNETSGSFEVTGFELRDVGVVLNVTPHINAQQEVLVDLKPEVSSFNGYTAIGSTNLSAPSFTVTQAITQVLIRSGETIAIGGLLTDSTTTTYTKVPILGDIPFLGKAFRSKRQTGGQGNNKVETLFFITVNVVDLEGRPIGTGKILSY